MPCESGFTREWRVESPLPLDVGREPDGTTVPDTAFVTIDIEHVSVESVV
jgi:hypothetical protein